MSDYAKEDNAATRNGGGLEGEDGEVPGGKECVKFKVLLSLLRLTGGSDFTVW